MDSEKKTDEKLNAEGRRRLKAALMNVIPGAVIGGGAGYGVGALRGLTYMKHFKVSPLAHAGVGAGLGATLGGINAYESINNKEPKLLAEKGSEKMANEQILNLQDVRNRAFEDELNKIAKEDDDKESLIKKLLKGTATGAAGAVGGLAGLGGGAVGGSVLGAYLHSAALSKAVRGLKLGPRYRFNKAKIHLPSRLLLTSAALAAPVMGLSGATLGGIGGATGMHHLLKNKGDGAKDSTGQP